MHAHSFFFFFAKFAIALHSEAWRQAQVHAQGNSSGPDHQMNLQSIQIHAIDSIEIICGPSFNWKMICNPSLAGYKRDAGLQQWW